MRYFFTLAFSFSSLLSLAQNAQCTLTLSGTVYDNENQPLAGATVVVLPNGPGTTTNNRGRFELKNLCEGNYQIEVRFVGFGSYRQEIRLGQNKQLTVSLEPDETALQEVVVEDHAPHVEATSTFNRLSGHELQETMGKPLGEALRQLAGVNTIQTGPAIFKPVIHGLHSNRVLILNNGIRQEGQNWGAEHAPEVDPFIASNLVVIKDAAAIKYGSDALGGVVLVNPAELPRDPGLGGQFHLIGASNNGSLITSGFVEGGSKKWKGLGWRAQGSIKKAGDSRAPEYVLSNTGFEEQSFSLAAAYHKANRGIDVFVSHFNTNIGILRGSATGNAEDLANAMERKPPQQTMPFTYDIKPPRQDVQHTLFKLNAHQTAGKNDYRLQYGFQLNVRSEFDQRRGSLVEIPALGFRLFTHTLDLEWQRQHHTRFQSNWGINVMHQVNEKIDGTQTIPFIPNFTHNAIGLFALEKFTLTHWTVEAGLRADLRNYDVAGFDFQNQLYRSEIHFQNISGTVSAQRIVGKRGSFTSSLSSAWRPANLAELYSIGTHQSAAAIEYGLLLDEETTQVVPFENSGVKPEQALKWVSGFTYTANRLTLDVAAYLNYIRHFIYLRPRGVTSSLRGVYPYFRYTQTNASFAGADLSVGYKLSERWSMNGKLSYLRARDVEENDFLIFIPANRADISIRYESGKKGVVSWYAESGLRWIAMQTRAPRVITPRQLIDATAQGIDLIAQNDSNFDFMAAPAGVQLLHAQVGITWQLKNVKLEARLAGENLTSESYREYTNRMRYYANETGRNFILGLHLSF